MWMKVQCLKIYLRYLENEILEDKLNRVYLGYWDTRNI